MSALQGERTAADPPVVMQRGLWYEELDVGTVYRHMPGRTISEGDNTLFTTKTMNGQSPHLEGFEEVTFLAPVRHGDTLYAETVITEKQLSESRPGQGVVGFHHIGEEPARRRGRRGAQEVADEAPIGQCRRQSSFGRVEF